MSRYLYAVVCGNPGCLWGSIEVAGEYTVDTLAEAKAEKRANNRRGCNPCGNKQHYIMRTPAKREWKTVR